MLTSSIWSFSSMRITLDVFPPIYLSVFPFSIAGLSSLLSSNLQ